MRIATNLPLKHALVGVTAAGLLGLGGVALAESPAYSPPGVTSYGWSLHPAGRQIDLANDVWWADRPYGQGLSPNGRWLVVSSAGASNESVKLVDVGSGKVRQTIMYKAPDAVNVGVVWSPDGTRVYVSAGGNDQIRKYTFNGSTLTQDPNPIVLAAGGGISYPMGLAISNDGTRLYAAENRSDSLAIVDLAGTAITHVSVGTCREQDGGLVNYPSNATAPIPPQCQPYGVTLSPNGSKAYVSNWGEESVSVINTLGHSLTGQIRAGIGTHPSALRTNPIAGRHQVAVTNGDSDTVSIIDTNSDTVVRTINLAPYPNAPQGSQPNALAFAPNGSTLYVANAGNNDVAVIKLGNAQAGETKQGNNIGGGDENGDRPYSVVGLIPTAWYPSAIDVSPYGRALYIANAKGMGAGPNEGYQQGQYGPPNQYVGSMMHGTLQIVRTPNNGALREFTQQVVRTNGFDERDKTRVASEDGGSVIPRRVGDRSPIKHVIYVIKENRTYDQVFGNLGKGNGDPNLTLFGDDSAPNIRNLARRFVLLDNYYAASEVSADGWSWSTEATANTYDQKTWPANYSDINRGRGYDWEGGNYATAANKNPKDSYLWDRLADQGISFRNYGFWTVFGTCPPNVLVQPTAPHLAARNDANYAGYNLSWPDSPLMAAVLRGQFCTPPNPAAVPPRITEWQREFAQYVSNNNLPTVEFVRLPNDHTAGRAVGRPTAKAYVADNDYAVGKLVETVSHSKYWNDTAIFVTEDDAQDGPDHVDGHRSESLVISPYTQTGKVDSTFYSTVSMLRTMELIIGIHPMTQYDAAATPMLNAFSNNANLTPYTAVVPPVLASGVPTNSAAAPMAAQMQGLSMTQADNLPERVLNEAIWRSVKGADSRMPGGDPTGD